jgi:dephospho-CoA kinase
VDKLGHKAIEDERKAVLARFGPDILDIKTGHINRKLLGEKVFGKADELAALEAIVHPAANRMTDAWIAEQSRSFAKNIIVINAALLHRSSAFGKLDHIILVTAPLFIRMIRAKKRDKLPWPAILKRFQSQQAFSSQYLSGKADIYRVENRGYFRIFSRKLERKLENRIDVFLSGEGMVQ